MPKVLRKGSFSMTPVQTTDGSERMSVVLNDEHLGDVKILEKDSDNCRIKCELAMPELGHSKQKATLLAFAALDYFFERSRVVKVCVDVIATDLARLDFYRFLGFAEEGRLSRHQSMGERFCDLILMAHFRETWDKKRKHLEDFLEQA